MSLVLAALLAASPAAAPALAACSWNQPGHNPFMGDVVAAVDRYRDIPAASRARLKARMAARQYDEIVSIQRDGILGKARYDAEIRDMHFGSGQVCGTVNRAAWRPGAQERGLVYCEGDQCILVPTVCRNVSRITRLAPPRPAVAGATAAAHAGPGGSGGASADVGPAAGGDAPATTARATPAAAAPELAHMAAGLGSAPADLPVLAVGMAQEGSAAADAWPEMGLASAGAPASWAGLAGASGAAAALLADASLAPAERVISALPGATRGALTDAGAADAAGLLPTAAAVPEPATLGLWAVGFGLLLALRARRGRAGRACGVSPA